MNKKNIIIITVASILVLALVITSIVLLATRKGKPGSEPVGNIIIEKTPEATKGVSSATPGGETASLKTQPPDITESPAPTTIGAETAVPTASKTPISTSTPNKTHDIGNSEVVGSTTEADNAAKNIIKASEKFNTTDNVFSAIDDFWSNPKKFFLDEKYKTSYPLILIDLDQKTNGAHNQIRKFYNNTAIFFSLNNSETNMILNYYKNIAFDRNLALQFGIGLVSVRTANYSDDTEIWIDEATLYTPYYLLAGGVWGDKIPMYPKMLEEMSSVKKSDTFLSGCVASKPSHCTEYIPGFDPLVNLCARYGDEVKNLNNHELVFSTRIQTQRKGFLDYYSGKVIEDYFIPFYDKTSNKYVLASFTSDNKLIGITIRKG